MRADAERNHFQLLAVAAVVLKEHGVEASLREIARRAEVGLGTLYRHFPTREALLVPLLGASFNELLHEAIELEISTAPGSALRTWLRKLLELEDTYRGVSTLMIGALADPYSALHATCVPIREATTRLLRAAQAQGSARRDIDSSDLIAILGSLAWVRTQPALAPQTNRVVDIILHAILID